MSNATHTTPVPHFEMRHRLGLALEHADVSVQAMADELGVSRNTVGNYLAGRTQPSTAVVRVWALRTGVPYAWLRDGIIDLDGPEGPGMLAGPGSGWVTAAKPRPLVLALAGAA